MIICGYAESENNDIPPNPADHGLQGSGPRFGPNGRAMSSAVWRRAYSRAFQQVPWREIGFLRLLAKNPDYTY
jgi:hypothetical protein